ncbi:MAG: hypothetical protein AAB525_00355 [Patescibacteria group bacterium]
MFFRFFRSKLFLIVGIAVLSFIVFNLIKVSIKQKAIQSEINQLSTKRDQIRLENSILGERLNKAISDSDKELLAKRTLNYKRPGETVFIFYPAPDVQVSQSAGGDNVLDEAIVLNEDRLEEQGRGINNALLWWHYFFE